MPKPRKRSRNGGPANPSRRWFLGGVLATSALTNFRVSRAAAAEIPPSTFKVLSHKDGVLLRGILNRLIPSEGKMPGAGDVGVASYIDEVMVEAPHVRGHVKEVLKVVRGRAAAGQSPLAFDRELTRIQGERQEAFDSLLHATYTGYYSDPRVVALINKQSPSEHGTLDAPDQSSTV